MVQAADFSFGKPCQCRVKRSFIDEGRHERKDAEETQKPEELFSAASRFPREVAVLFVKSERVSYVQMGDLVEI